MNLKEIDIEFMLDKSASMSERDCPGNKSRWDYARETLMGLARAAEAVDADGLNITPFAGKFQTYRNAKAETVNTIFKENSPNGSTNTAIALKDRLEDHFRRREQGSTKPTCIICMTDGAPTDTKAVEDVIIAATKRMKSDDELAIQMVRVGNDVGAAEFLKHLDDNLVKNGAAFDIVDTTDIGDTEDFSFEELVNKSFND